MIEKANRSHLDWIVSAQIKMAKETEDLRLDPNTVHKGVSAVFDDPYKGQYWLAMEQGQPIACMLTIREWSDWRAGYVLWIHSVYVNSDQRGRGIFKEMYNSLKSIVIDSSQLRGLRLYVDKSNKTAQKVYEACGMSSEHYELFEWLS